MGKKYFSGIVKGFFRFFNRLRLFIINIVFWGIIAAVAVLLFQGEIVPDVNKNSVLKISLNGTVVEQYSGGYQSEIEGMVSGGGEILLRDIREVLDFAASDDRVTSVFLDLSNFQGSGFAKLQEIAHSIEKIKNNGKKIVCYSDSFDNSSYYLASHTGTVVLDPLGEVRLRGFGRFRNYYRKGLDKYSIRMNVFKAGDFKSAVDPYLHEKMPDNDREALSLLYDRLMKMYADDISEGRGMSRDLVFDYMKNYHIFLRNSGGDGAAAALENNFVDFVGDFDSALNMIEEAEEIIWTKYLKVVKKEKASSDNKIAVITASGMILDGEYEPGKIGSETFKTLFEKASDSPDIKAVVFRIDSGGGSATASEVIRRAVVKLKEKGKAVIVSMSSTAASGGYWVSSDADRIISYPSTITGSIGVFAVLPDFSEFLEKYFGITVDGYSSVDSPSSYRPDRELDEREKEIIQLGVDSTYSRFINIVSEGREIPPEDVMKIAGGRIWSGIDAAENKLVDSTGYFEDAVNAAAEAAGLAEYSLLYLDPEEDWKSQAFRELAVLVKMLKSSSVISFFSDIMKDSPVSGNVLEYLEPGCFYSWTWIDSEELF